MSESTYSKALDAKVYNTIHSSVLPVYNPELNYLSIYNNYFLWNGKNTKVKTKPYKPENVLLLNVCTYISLTYNFEVTKVQC